jgi:DNA (cytosine-5)-methyltransferase 1
MINAIDLFAGAGGFSTGAQLAGVRVVWAANHWQAAVETHRANHPETKHSCQDLHQADWQNVPPHDLLLASPACQGHSRARGKDRPHHDQARSTAWAVVSCAEFHRPAAIVVENVPEFTRWLLFPAWKEALAVLGYALSINLLDAADFGVPQHRRRVYIIATRSQAPFHFKHAPQPFCPVSSILNGPCGQHWSPIRTKCENTRARVRAGRKTHGDRFLVAYYGNEDGGRSIHRPLGTVTTRDRYALIEGTKMRMLTVDENRAAMGFPASYKLPPNKRLATHFLGNAVCPPVARAVISQLIKSL